jgi:hypothetical protein
LPAGQEQDAGNANCLARSFLHPVQLSNAVRGVCPLDWIVEGAIFSDN